MFSKPYLRNVSNRSSSNYGKYVESGSASPDGRRFPGNVIQFTTVSGGTIHPTQKPVELFEYLIKTYTDAGELVVDICAGSGTAAVACIHTGRRFLCFENAPEYFAVASERIRNEQEAAREENH